MSQEYNNYTVAVGVGIAVIIFTAALIIFNWSEIVEIASTEGLLGN